MGRVRAVQVRRLFAAALTLALAWFYVDLFRDTIIDDAFISLQYASMLVDHGSWSFLPDRVSNTATSPLNVLVTAGAGLFARTMVDAIVWVTAIELALLLLLLVRVSRRLFDHAYFGAFAFVALATNCLLVSTIGLEGVLFALILVLTIDLYLGERWTLLAVALGLLVLARPDGVLLFGIYLLALYRAGHPQLRFTLVFGAVVVPWLLFSWIHLGSLVPDTLVIKLSQRGWGMDVTLLNGLGLYIRRFPLEMLSALILLPLTIFAWMSSRPNVSAVATILGAYGVLHLLAYGVAGIPPYHWYYVNQVVPIALVGSLGVASIIEGRRPAGRPRSWLLRGALAAVPALGLAAFVMRSGLPLREAPIHTNHATQAQYREIGTWIRANIPDGEVVFNTNEMGTIAYYSERTIVNEFSDPNIPYQFVLKRYPNRNRLVQLAVDVNYFWRRMQPALPAASCVLALLPMPNDGDSRFGSRIMKSWETSSRWVPNGRQYLLRGPQGVRAGQ